jgi:hypothetical protein
LSGALRVRPRGTAPTTFTAAGTDGGTFGFTGLQNVTFAGIETASPIPPAPPAPAPTPIITGAVVIGGSLVLIGPDGQPSAVVPVAPGTLAFITDTNGDGQPDLVVISPTGNVVVVDTVTGRLLALTADLNADGLLDVLVFSPITGALQLLIFGGSGLVIPVN